MGMEYDNRLKIVIATGNFGKVRDFHEVLNAHSHAIEVVSIKEYGGMPDVEESAPDFVGNARLKALAANAQLPRNTGVWTLADDSGLSVDALNGAPGVHSARFSGPDATDASNRVKLLECLAGLSEDKRGAHFVCHLCLISPSGGIFDFEGRCYGRIAFAAAGCNGFGYDPLFIPDGMNCTWGEMGENIKNSDSHRAKATRQLLNWLSEEGL